MTLQRGDRVMIGDDAWVVVGIAPDWVYVTYPHAPTWAPQRFKAAAVTHVWRDGTWVAISQPAGE